MQALVATALVAMLAACGGGGDEPPVVVTAAADAISVNGGSSGQLLANDRIGDAVATTGAGGNATFTLTSGALPAGVAVDNGVVSVATTAVPGVVNLSYRLCLASDGNNCATATAAVTIPAPPIVAVADSFNLAAGNSADVLVNDTLAGAPATAGTVTVSAVNPPPTGITLDSTGLVTVDNTASAGSHAVSYRICQTVAATNCAAAVATVSVPALGALTGRAIDSATTLGVPDVRVSVGSLTVTTDANGAFSISGVPAAERVTVRFDAATHAESARIARVLPAANTDVQARLVRVGATADVDVASGGTVTMPASTARVQLAGGSVQRADGSLPSGAMQVQITPIDPASDTAVMPGDFTASVGGVATPIDSFGALNVRLADAGGAALNLRAGQSATIRIPVASRDPNPPATIPLFYFDGSSGRWVQDGTATLAGSGANSYYEGTVSHFSTWNADQLSSTVQISGCVADAAGNRVAGATIGSDGVDYSGTSSTITDNAGNFTVGIRLNSSATLVALSGNLLSNTLRVGPYSADATLTDCLMLSESGAGVTMKLTWGAAPDDLDSHLYTPSGAHIYYSSRGSLLSAPFANLDVDDTSSYGPEVVTLVKLMVGTYKYAVHNYSGYNAGPIAASGARVELSIPGRAVELFAAPAVGETSDSGYWQLFELDVDARCNVSVRRVNAYSPSAPANPPAGTPVYCTP